MMALLFDSAWLIFSAGVMYVWLSTSVIPAEEAFLHAHYGKEYDAYAATVPRWLFTE